MSLLPTDPKERKKIPLWSGLMKYFPDALIAVAKVSYAGNEQHNPGQKLQWSREKSSDHEDTLLRHLMESGSVDSDGQLHSAKLVWRALAKLQLEIEATKKEEKQATGGLYWRGTTIPVNRPEPKQPASHNDWDGLGAL
jgi:hypothetical protein